jgi:hypothetical protein
MFIVLFLLALLFTEVSASSLEFLTSSGIQRSYWKHLPSNYDSSKTYPVVIAFHGSSKIGFDIDGFAMEADTRLSLPLIPTKYSESVCQIYSKSAHILMESRKSLFTPTAFREPGQVHLMLKPPLLRTSSSSQISSTT